MQSAMTASILPLQDSDGTIFFSFPESCAITYNEGKARAELGQTKNLGGKWDDHVHILGFGESEVTSSL